MKRAAAAETPSTADPAAHGEVQLYFLRHAHAGNPVEWNGADSERPLSAKGKRQAALLGHFLAERGFSVDTIVTSPKLRALQTAELVAPAIGARYESDHRLAGPLDLDLLRKVVRDAGGSRVMLVGHDPDFSELCAELIGAASLPLKKGALARLDAQMPLRPSGAILRWLVPPDLITRD